MRDVELYRQLLRIEVPWKVERVDLSVAEQRVDVVVGHANGVRWPCPECGTELAAYDHAEERAWRHLDSWGFITWLHARPPRVSCPAHGVRQVRLPWAGCSSAWRSMCSKRPTSPGRARSCGSAGMRAGI